MRAREPDTPETLDFVHRVEKLLESTTVAWVAVGVHVLAEKLNLPKTPAGERSSLAHDVGDGPASLPAPGERNDAERAEVVAALHDRDVGLDPGNPVDPLGRNVEILRMAADLDDFLPGADDHGQDFRKLHEALRSKDE